MIKKINFLLFLLFFIACRSLDEGLEMSKEFKDINPKFSSYVQDFVALTEPYYSEEAFKTLSLGQKRLNSGRDIGICKIFTTSGGPEVLVDNDFWTTSDGLQKEALMLHELGHCLCGLDHQHFEGGYAGDSPPIKVADRLKNGYLEDGCPDSIMHPVIVSSSCYEQHRSHYRFEMRLRCYSLSIVSQARKR